MPLSNVNRPTHSDVTTASNEYMLRPDANLPSYGETTITCLA